VDRTCEAPRQIEHPDAAKRTVALQVSLGQRFWRGLADLLDRYQRQLRQRFRMRRGLPFVIRTHHRDHAAGCIGGGFESFRLPLHQRRLHIVTLGLAVEHLADGGAVMREIRVQPHEAAIAGPVDAGDGVPGRPRRFAGDAQVALGAALDRGVAHVDADMLRFARAQFPDFGGGKPRCGDADLRCGGDAERRRQLRLVAGEPHGVERSGFAAGGSPDVSEDFAGTLHCHRPCRILLTCSSLSERCPTRQGVAMAAIDPLTAGGVLLATAATDAVYVMFTSAVVARKRVPAATWISIWYVLSSYAVISYTENWIY